MWRKSTYSASNGQCVEVAFKRSSSCESSGCVEVAVGDEVWVRDSKLGDASPVLNFTRAEWDAFTAGVRDGQFD